MSCVLIHPVFSPKPAVSAAENVLNNKDAQFFLARQDVLEPAYLEVGNERNDGS